MKRNNGQGQKQAEAKVLAVLKKLPGAEVDALVAGPDGQDVPEFRQIAGAVMAWYQLLFASGIFDRRNERVMEVLAASMVTLGTLVKYAYALGVRRGRIQAGGARKRRKS